MQVGDTVYITKYGLSTGIIAATVQATFSDSIRLVTGIYLGDLAYYSLKDYETNLEAALAKVEEMRLGRIRGLRKQLEKLENYNPKIKYQEA